MKDNILVCMETKNTKNVYPGSVVKKCTKCGQEVYVAPSGQKQLASGEFDIECNTCFLAAIGQESSATVRVSAEAVQEIKAYHSRN